MLKRFILKGFAVASIAASLSSCGRTPRKVEDSSSSPGSNYIVITDEAAQRRPATAGLGISIAEARSILILGGSAWEYLSEDQKVSDGKRTDVQQVALVGDHVLAEFYHRKATNTVIRFKAQSGRLGACGSFEDVGPLIGALSLATRPPVLFSSQTQNELERALRNKVTARVYVSGGLVEIANDGCVSWIDVDLRAGSAQ